MNVGQFVSCPIFLQLLCSGSKAVALQGRVVLQDKWSTRVQHHAKDNSMMIIK